MERESRGTVITAPAASNRAGDRRAAMIAGAFQKISGHPALWTFLAFLACWRVYTSIAPHIERVDLDASGRIEVVGRGFGAAKGESRLEFGGITNEIPLEIVEWRDRRVVANLGTPTNGSITLTRDLWTVGLPDTALVYAPLRALPSQPYGYAVPVQPAAQWPLFRRDHRNTGHAPFPAKYNGAEPWSFETGNTVAATPVIDADGVVYLGTGSGAFHAIDGNGQPVWSYSAAGRIVGAAALVRTAHGEQPAGVIFPAGDGRLYRVSTEPGAPCGDSTFEVKMPPLAQRDSAFDSNVAIGDDGTIYAGNHNLRYYAVAANGAAKWTHKTGDSASSSAGIDADGTVYWGGADGVVRAVNTDGSTKWTKGTQGVVSAAPAVGSGGTVYVGSFDSYLYALDAATGSTAWTFKTGDHIVATVALDQDKSGNTTTIYLASTDGHLYALGRRGELLWEYDTGQPVRSSPAVGLGPKGEHPGIVYLGGGDGKLYAFDGATGRRRWSFDTTSSDPELRDRNDVTSSVALGADGVYAGTESGALWFVPYDYCLHASDARCNTTRGEGLPGEQFGFAYVSPGGTTYAADPPPIPAAAAITLGLITRENGKSINARLCDTPYLCSTEQIQIETEPSFPFRAHVSGDGRYLHIVPTDILQADTEYTIRVEAGYYTSGFQFGSLTLGGRLAGTAIEKVRLRTQPAMNAFPLAVGDDTVSAFELVRVAAPIPATVASLHQGDLDASAWIVSVIHKRPPQGALPGRVALWGIGARTDKNGVLVPDPDPRRTLAFSGHYEGDNFILEGSNFVWSAGAVSLPVSHLELRGQIGSDLRVGPGASLIAEAAATSMPGFASQLTLGGLLNSTYDTLLLVGTYLTRPYDPAGRANKRPPGLRVSMIERARPREDTAGKVVADLTEFARARYKIDEHRFGVVLIDRIKHEIVPIDYVDNTYLAANAAGEIDQIILSVPPKTSLSHDIEIAVLVDAFPVHRAPLGWSLIAK